MASRLTEQWQEHVMGDSNSAPRGAVALRGLAAGGARLYEHGLDVYLDMERLGLRRRDRLPVPVVSVGNLTVGGTGKTPMTCLICRHLQEQGKRVAILSRGHGGKGSGVRLVSDDHGNIARGAADVGDEPYLLASRLPGVPVLVGKDRRESGREAMRRFAIDVLVLDDGFQFWQLDRDLDIVLVDARLPFDNGKCLPRGLLREPPRHLSRAGVVVATRSEGMADEERVALADQLHRHAPEKPIFFAQDCPQSLTLIDPLPAEPRPLNDLWGKSVVAWSAIARPDLFRKMLEQTVGASVAGHFAEPDHYSPTEEDVRAVEDLAKKEGAEAIVVTEKDAVKWPKQPNFPTFSLRIRMEIEDEDLLMQTISQRIFRETDS